VTPLLAAVLAAAAVAAAPADMSARELAGQRVVHGFAGASAPAPLLRRIRRGHAAGVILFARNIRSRGQVRALVRRLQAARPAGAPPLIVAIDQEGGLVKRLPGAPSRAAAEMDSARVARSEGRATARNLAGVGVNVDLAPVLDVARPGGAIHAQRRAFGRTHGRVTRRGGAFAAGLASGGVAAAGKHFPGLGRARADQDRTVNFIRASRRRLRAVDEAPYERLGSRLPLVMVSSAIYPALDGRRPALFSRAVATRELRGHVGFTGVSITDALDVPSLAGYGSPGARGVRSARAGMDVLLYGEPAAGVAAQRALARAIAAGRMSHVRSERAAARVLALRDRLR
jgi:beta-N-acetylhexosaminidase